ncbi:MAG TPA: aminotransferase class I/II-fold pyridoxal phosphate-dependent enzyme [Acidimicrobiia bacterium]|nr:aminotransferase class I/II-fold pyridoxal phosphate-dependent enzyme [Acidimicrobiia bacterium]
MAPKVSRINERLRPFGSTIFADITSRAVDAGAINLGQGFPNFDGPGFVKEAAIEAIQRGMGQYAPTNGLPDLVAALAKRYRPTLGEIDPARHVTVTSGCTEALAATFLGVLQPGDGVILIEPTYDAYPADVALAGAQPQFLTLRPPDFGLDPDKLESLITEKTRAIVVNTPHNPSGRVFSLEELQAIAQVCRRHDLIAITDEVYEHMVYEGEHVSLGSMEGMWERTITLSSLGKTFSLTGWKVGWAVAPSELTNAVRSAHQFLTFATATPLQHAAAVALGAPASYFQELRESYRSKRDLLAAGLDRLGFEIFMPAGTYFLMADHSRFGDRDDVAFVHRLIDEVGVAAIPPSAFYHDPQVAKRLVRFAFCKDEATLVEALDRLSSLKPVAR